MFIPDRPIDTKNEDSLGRTRFSKDLGKSIASWNEKESLVIALYGKWGSGKSSAINLMKEEISDSHLKDRITVIEFNPWFFSDLHNLTNHFFNELAKEIELKLDSDKDKGIARKLRQYSQILNFSPNKSLLIDLQSKILLGLGIAGISSSQIIQWLGISQGLVNWILFGLGFVSLLIEFFKGTLSNVSEFFEQRSREKTIIELKGEIRKELLTREKKLLIVIDDIDRLNQQEIREIFRLVRINADFPNTVYLLSFDRSIIEKNLEEQAGVSGKEYLEKIVQVNFDIPVAPSTKIAKLLFAELDRILDNLPKVAKGYFDNNNPHWTNVYHSGYKNFFQNIRDVKRYSSSLEFNLSLMNQEEILEVNPIDFMAIEAIRVFAPNFYGFMKYKKEVFTSTSRESRSRDENPIKEEIEKEIKELPFTIQESVRELILRLFPQINSIYQYGYSSYGGEWHSEWSKELRVCSGINYNSYFTLIPGGDDEELSQLEINNILDSAKEIETFEAIIKNYIEKNKIRKVLTRMQDYTRDSKYIRQENIPNVIQALFNLSDYMPDEKLGFSDFGSDMDVMRIIHQLLIRDSNKQRNYEVLKKSIKESKGLYGPIHRISIESSRLEKGKPEEELAISTENIKDLQQLCLKRIQEFRTEGKLLKHKKLVSILYRWKEWDVHKGWEEFVQYDVIKEDSTLIEFLEKFISEIQSLSMGDYGVRNIKRYNYKSLQDFINLEGIRNRLLKIKENNQDLYINNKEIIHLFLDNYDKKDENEFD